MIRAIGFLGSLSGDLVMCTVAARAFKEQHPDSHLTFSCSKPFYGILPLFYDNPYIDSFHVWDAYEGWPNEVDKKYIEDKKFDFVFNALAPHTALNWYNYFHYTRETCNMLGLKAPQDLSCCLIPWFGKDKSFEDCVAISAFPSRSKQLDKTLSLSKWEGVVEGLKKMGLRAVQLGGQFDVQIPGALKPDTDWVSAAKILYSSKFQITCDTSWAWIGSAYKVKCLGLYGINYPDMTHPWSHCPINANAQYLLARQVGNIEVEEVLESISKTFL